MEATRDRIIVATNELFRRQGYNGTTIAQISTASEATIGSMYHFFPGGKEALAAEVIRITSGVYRDLFLAISAEAANPVQAFSDFFAGAAAVLEDSGYIDPCPIGGIAREVANTSEPLRQAASAAFQLWIDAASSYLRSAGVPEATSRELANLFVATVEGTFVVSRTQRSPEALLAAGKHVGELARRAVANGKRAAKKPLPSPQNGAR